MTWQCLNPAAIASMMPHDNPVAARWLAEESAKDKVAGAWRDGLHWGDERLWQHTGFWDYDEPIPFNLSPLLPEGFPIGDPCALMATAETLLREGDWAKGWQYYEFRHQLEQGQRQMPRLCLPHWDGKSECRRLLVHADQGAGDAIMFSRYLRELDRRGVVWDFRVEPSLFRLMAHLPYAGRIITNLEEHLYDAHIPVESLPLALDLFEPLETPPPLGLVRQYTGKHVGIVWAGQWFHPRNAHRCLTLEQILQHVPADAESIVSLQMGAAREQLRFAPNVIDDGEGIRDWMDTAAILAELSMLVTVDTGIAHLAGTMGIPTKLILREPAEWRWGHGSTTPWYDSVQIVRINASSCDSHLPQQASTASLP